MMSLGIFVYDMFPLVPGHYYTCICQEMVLCGPFRFHTIDVRK